MATPQTTAGDSVQPHEHWRMYFTGEYNDEARTLVAQLKTHVRTHALHRLVDPETQTATLPVAALSPALAERGAFRRLIDERPEHTLACAGLAMCELYHESLGSATAVPVKVVVRVSDWGPPTAFRDIRANLVGRLVAVCGTIVRAAAVRPLPTAIAFKCTRCAQHTVVATPAGVYRPPARCGHCSISRTFAPDFSAPSTCCANWQRLKVQETRAPGGDDEARVPRVIDAELTEDLVDSVVPGDAVVLTGIVKTLPVAVDGPMIGDAIYIDVVHVARLRVAVVEPSGCDVVAIVREAASKGGDGALRRVVSSFCPRIYGHAMVKLGLLLGLLGGTSREVSGEHACAVRSAVHVLVVGDPGMGKSQMLAFAAAVAPRAVSVCANTSSAAGLTATVHDAGGAGIEAGALVLADRGVCCIDEFDKLGSDGGRALLAAMEQQTVSIAKAGVVATLPARTAILAAANPAGGHYAASKSLSENIRMDRALLSRFDLVFLLIDRPNVTMDRLLSGHVLEGTGTADGPKGNGTVPTLSEASTLGSVLGDAHMPLWRRLDAPADKVEPFDEGALRAYIAYAREQVRPRLSEAAAVIIREHYLSLRSLPSHADEFPVTTRHLEALMRLAEARAKLELRPFVTAADARDAVDLSRYCAVAVLPSSDASTGVGGTFAPPSKRGRVGGPRQLMNELVRVSARTAKTEYTEDELHSLYNALRITTPPFTTVLDTLRETGCLMCPRPNVYRLLVT